MIINLLESVETYNDTSWQMTFYFVSIIALLIGITWTYIKIFVKKKNKLNKNNTTGIKNNPIYENSEDIIEETFNNKYFKNNKKNKYR